MEEVRRLRSLVNRTLPLLDAARRGRLLEAASLIRKNPRVLQEMHQGLKRLVDARSMPRAEQDIKEAIAEAKLKYKDALERAFAKAGISFTGVWPTYLLWDALELQVDLDRERVRIVTGRLPSLDIPQIVRTSRRLLEELLARPFDPAAFATILAGAYRRALDAQGGDWGDYVEIRKLFQKLAQRCGPSYTIRYFAIDLFRLFRASCAESVPVVVELRPAGAPASGIFVATSCGGYIGGVAIRPLTTMVQLGVPAPNGV